MGQSGAASLRLGLERDADAFPAVMASGRFGLVMNQASVDHRFDQAHHRLNALFPGRLAALFSPQHGLFSEQQDNMIESPHGRDAELGLPVHSLYSETRSPTPEMLDGLDALVVDLQDVGTRIYTYVWTALLCMRACSKAGIRLVILDRPNPMGGAIIEGPRLDALYKSFVGLAEIPMRHGLTIGELMRYLADREGIRASLDVVPMENHAGHPRFDQIGRAWVPPSPNLPRWDGAMVYPGQVLLEGTNLSEGRGTTTPFEVVGAPFIDPFKLKDRLQRFELPVVVFRPIRFVPTFQKWSDRSCGGLFLHVTDPERFRPYRTTAAILASVRALWPNDFRWREPPYEYEEKLAPIDILSGSSSLRLAIDAGSIAGPSDLDVVCQVDAAAWQAEIAPYRLYSP